MDHVGVAEIADQTSSLPTGLQELFEDNPLMAAIKLARFKFPARLLSPEDSVLDLGCGVGQGAYFYACHTRGEVVGIDLYADVEYARQTFRRDNLRFVQGDLLDPPREILGSRFDAVVSVDVIEHFSEADGRTLIERYAGLLRPGGTMILGSPNVLSSPYRSPQSRSVHVHEYEPEELRALCAPYFGRTFLFSMNDEVVHTGFSKMAWFFWVVCTV